VRRRTDGIAMLYALLMMVVVVGVGALMFARTVAEIRHSGDDAAIVQTLLLARGAANMGGQSLQGVVRDELHEIVEARSSTVGRWSFGNDGAGVNSPTPNNNDLVNDLRAVAQELQSAVDAILCSNTTVTPSSGGTGRFTVYFTETACGEPLPAGITLPAGRFVKGNPRSGVDANAEQTYAIPFVMMAEGSLGQYRRNVVLQGEYRFTVGRGSFAKYALFTNVHRTSRNGDEVWFTEDTLFDGPVHTNEFFRFYRNPWFGGKVTSAGCRNPGDTACDGAFDRQGAEFYGEGFIRREDMRPSESNPRYTNRFGTHAPALAEVDWRVNFIALPTNNQNQAAAAQASGIYIGGHVSTLQLYAGNANGDPLVPDGNGGYTTSAAYQYIVVTQQNGTTRRYRFGPDLILYERQGSNWINTGKTFNGVIFVNGRVDRFTGPARQPGNSNDPRRAPPALARFAQVTVAANNDIRITGDLKYEDPPCTGVPTRLANGNVEPATCDNLDAVNVLGVYTQNGSIRIGNNNSDGTLNAPRDVTIHGVLMTGRQRVEVEDYDKGSPRGAVNLLGGIIEYYYGAFGRFNPNNGSQISGYDRRFKYDERMSMGIEPPYFPTVTQDGVQDVVLFSFGQREQVY